MTVLCYLVTACLPTAMSGRFRHRVVCSELSKYSAAFHNLLSGRDVPVFFKQRGLISGVHCYGHYS